MRLPTARARAQAAPPLARAASSLTALLERAAVPAHARADSARAARSRATSRRRTRCSRLLQGDVGSGKTVVAALAAAAAVENGLQAAVMAPTEILAEQH